MDAIAILDGLADAVVLLDGVGRAVFANPAAQALLERPPAALLQRNAREWLHPDHWHEIERLLDCDAAAGPARFEARIGPLDGRWRGVAVAASRTMMQGECRLVLALREHAGRGVDGPEAWRERNYLRSLLDVVDVGIVACDAEGRVVLHNPAFAMLHPTPAAGQTAEEWLSACPFLKPDGLTPQPAGDAPLLRALRGEPARNHEFALLNAEGELELRRASGSRLFDRDGRVIGAVAALHDITGQWRAEEALRRQALHDPLTGLPNRALLFDRLGNALARAERHGTRMSVFLIDLDHFKTINDGLGHAAGDRLLTEVARRLLACLRPGDTVARLGGDEFVILCEDIDDGEDERAIADRVCAAIADPVDLDGRTARVTGSLGLRRAANGDSPETLLRDADAAMYLAKERGRNRCEAFDDPLRMAALQRLEIEQTLLRALSNEGLRLVFQPVVSAGSGWLVGTEALVRCHDAAAGTLGPGKFLAVAEAMGLMSEIDRWVLDRVCHHARQLMDTAPDGRIVIGCNLSGRLLAQPDLGELVEGALRRHGVPPDRLALELTETALIQAPPEARRTLARIRDAGTAVGIDDFGTGYASLASLRDFPVSFVKIDRAFMTGLGMERPDGAFIEAVVGLSHALGMTVIAEGVEYLEQAERLRDLGCDHLQGYLISRPVPADALEGLARARMAGAVPWAPLFRALDGGLARSVSQVA